MQTVENLTDKSAQLLWEKAIEQLKKELSQEACERWIHPLKPLAITDEGLTLGVPDDFFKSWIIDHYGRIILLATREVSSESIGAVSYQVVQQELTLKSFLMIINEWISLFKFF